MVMMKRSLIALLLALAVLAAAADACLAEIIPPQGEGQIGVQAVVLCEKLALRQERDTHSKSLKTLRYGDKMILTDIKDGWAQCFLSDAEGEGPAGYVGTEYLLIDPAWYKMDETTTVYAWNDTAAPKVALLNKGTTLPLLKDEGDWLIISLRGATGWIQKTEADRLSTVKNEMLQSVASLKKVLLVTSKGTYTLSERASLGWVESNFASARQLESADSPFDAKLTLTTSDGKTLKLEVATDGNPYFRTEDGTCFSFGSAGEDDSAANVSEAFWNLFGLTASDAASATDQK